MTNSWQRWAGIMKCVPFEEKRLLKWRPPFIIQPKYDGDRCRCYPLHDGTAHLLLTSEENPFFSVPLINEELAHFRLNIKLDGELYSHHLNIEGGHHSETSQV